MPKILTFTANLLAETTYHYGDWKPAATQRAPRETFQVGGKGINVSKMLTRLGSYNEAICFPGGHYGPRCLDWIENKNIRTRAYTDDCETRSGTVVSSERIAETTFLGLNSQVSEIAIQQCVAELQTETNHHLFAICGSIQNWDSPQWNPLRDYLATRRVECHLVVDTYGPSLKWFLQQKPEVIKINRQELESLFPKDKQHAPTQSLLQEISSQTFKTTWIVTDGGNSIWIKEKKTLPYEITPPKTVCVSATGCGDVFFATFLDAVYNRKNGSIRDAATLAADYASRNASKPEIAEFSLE